MYLVPSNEVSPLGHQRFDYLSQTAEQIKEAMRRMNNHRDDAS